MGSVLPASEYGRYSAHGMKPKTKSVGEWGVNIEAEEKVIGSILKEPSLLASPELERLNADCFVEDRNKLLFVTVARMRSQGKPLDRETLVTEMVTDDTLNRLNDPAGLSTGAEYIRRIDKSVVHHGAAAYYADILVTLANRRRLFAMGNQICLDAMEGREFGEIAESVATRLDALQSRGSIDALPLYSAAEFAAGEFTLDYLIPGWVPKGQPGVIGAPQKALKTTLALELLLSMATGRMFLGIYPTVQTPVLMLSGESGLATLQDTARRICATKDLFLQDVRGFHISPWIPQFESHDDLRALRQLLETTGAQVLTIDPAYLCMSGEGSENLMKQGRLLRAVSLVAAELGITLIIVHHLKKTLTDPWGLPELSWLSWAGFAEFARWWVLLNRRRPYLPGSGVHHLWAVAGGSAGHSSAWGLDIDEGTPNGPAGRYWSVAVVPLAQAQIADREATSQGTTDKRDQAKVARENKEDAKAIDTFRAGGTLTKEDLRKALGMSGDKTTVVVNRLLEREQIEETTVTKGKREFPAFRLSGLIRTDPDKSGLSASDDPDRTRSPIRAPSVRPDDIPEIEGDAA